MNKKNFLSILMVLTIALSFSQDLMITGVFNVKLESGASLKGIELYAVNDIEDLSKYGLNIVNQGEQSGTVEYTFTSDRISSGSHIVITDEGERGSFYSFFDFDPSYIDDAIQTDGISAVELISNNIIIDVFGDSNTNGSGKTWEYTDGWAYRLNDKFPNATFKEADWKFSGINSFKGTTYNPSADAPFPLEFFSNDPNLLVNWTGATSSEWNDASNWYPEIVPIKSFTVNIPKGLKKYPIIKEKILIENLTMEDGASLISNVPLNTDITYYRDIKDTDWHLISAPVIGETIGNLLSGHPFADGKNRKQSIGSYNNNNTSWNYYTYGNIQDLESGKGFALKFTRPETLSFRGTLNTSNVSVKITENKNAFNLLGNPYTAYLSSSKFLSENSSALSEQTIWLWNGKNYETKVAADNFILAPTQGFFVKSKDKETSVTFNALNRIHNDDTFMKSNRTEVHLSLKEGNKESKARLYYTNTTTKGFDNGYDGTMFGGASYDFALFTQLVADNKGENFTVQSLPINDLENTVVPVGIIAKANKEIIFTVESINLPKGINVYLEDRINGTTTNLSKDNYKITLNKNSNGVGQFYLHTTSQRLTANKVAKTTLQNVNIYSSRKSEITIVGLKSKNSTLNIFSILGKKIFSGKTSSENTKTIKLPELTSGIYVVKLTSELGEIIKKITLK